MLGCSPVSPTRCLPASGLAATPPRLAVALLLVVGAPMLPAGGVGPPALDPWRASHPAVGYPSQKRTVHGSPAALPSATPWVAARRHCETRAFTPFGAPAARHACYAGGARGMVRGVLLLSSSVAPAPPSKPKSVSPVIIEVDAS